VLSLDIDAAISDKNDLEARATMRLKGLVDGARLLSFDLSRSLRIKSVSLDSGQAVPFYQHANLTEQEIRRNGENSFVVVLPQALRSGQEITLRFAYSGDALDRISDNTFYTGGRGLWYPNAGSQDTAAFTLTFHYPPAYTLAATGSKVREWDEAGQRHAIWNNNGEFAVAGFLLGKFATVVDDSTPVSIAAQATTSAGSIAAENLVKDVREALTYFSDRFGPYPHQRLTVSQFAMNSLVWPALLNVPQDLPAAERLRASGIADQWLGNVRWSSYHDQWLADGLASYAGAMYIDRKYPDRSPLREMLNDARSYLMDRSPDGKTNESAGPIWLGPRLASSRTPQGYSQMMHAKSLWVLHMLRMLMQRDAPDPDAPFFKILRDLTERHSGTVTSTYDFKAVAEKYMTKALDLRDDRKLDWFFDQWVFGTGVPTYRLDYKVDPGPNGFTIEGTVTQSDVSENFVMPIPLYADADFLGRVVVTDEPGHFRFAVKKRPERVVMDPQGTVLSK